MEWYEKTLFQAAMKIIREKTMISDVSDAIYDSLLKATREAVKKLFQVNEHFYYCSLMMLEDATPCISACSEEALAETVKNSNGRYTADDLRWSYADSPYFGYGFQEYFKSLDAFYCEHMNRISDDEYDAAIEMWLSLMERVMKTLDEEGMFGTSDNRKKIFINAEYMPPDVSNVERGRRLNPLDIFERWYKENWDESDSEDIGEYYYALNHPKMCKVIVTQSITDKKIAMKIRKDFNVPMGIGEFLMFCKHTPCTINDNFSYNYGKELISREPMYSEIISIIGK